MLSVHSYGSYSSKEQPSLDQRERTRLTNTTNLLLWGLKLALLKTGGSFTIIIEKQWTMGPANRARPRANRPDPCRTRPRPVRNLMRPPHVLAPSWVPAVSYISSARFGPLWRQNSTRMPAIKWNQRPVVSNRWKRMRHQLATSIQPARRSPLRLWLPHLKPPQSRHHNRITTTVITIPITTRGGVWLEPAPASETAATLSAKNAITATKVQLRWRPSRRPHPATTRTSRQHRWTATAIKVPNHHHDWPTAATRCSTSTRPQRLARTPRRRCNQINSSTR